MSDCEDIDLAVFVPDADDGGASKPKKRRLRKRGLARKARMDIQKQMQSKAFALPRAAFKRLVYEIVAQINPEMQITKGVFDALQAPAEEHITHIFKQCQNLAVFTGAKTITREGFLLSAGVEPANKDGTGWHQQKKTKKVALPTRNLTN
jgi:histone H3/H4